MSETSDKVRRLLRGAWAATAGDRARLVVFVVLFVVAYTLELAVPWAIGYTLGILAEEGLTDAALRSATTGIGVYTALRLTASVVHHTARYVQSHVSYTARLAEFRVRFDGLLNRPLRWHVVHHSGETLSKLHRGAGAVDSIVGTLAWQVVEGTVKIVLASAALFTLDALVATNVVVLGGVTVAALIAFTRRRAVKIREQNAFWDRLNGVFVDGLGKIVTVKTLGVEDASREKLVRRAPDGRRILLDFMFWNELKWGATTAGYALVVGSSLLLYFYQRRGIEGAFDIAQVYVMMSYLDRVFGAIGAFNGYYTTVIDAAEAYDDGYGPAPGAVAVPLAVDPSWTALRLTGIRVTWADRGEQAAGLRGVDLEVRRGERVALVGATGSGKSTLLKVLAGVYERDAGSVVLDGRHELSTDALASMALLVPQEPEIFADSVRFNLTMGREVADDDLRAIAELCQLGPILERLPNGLDSSVAEGGLDLSVGERQRISVARGLLLGGHKPLLMLDEPTASLDPATEKRVLHGLLSRFGSRTIFAVCHRLNVVPLFDRVVVVRDGVVVETGAFDELLARKGPFYWSWEEYRHAAMPADEASRQLEQTR